jgi:hypothetical protein
LNRSEGVQPLVFDASTIQDTGQGTFGCRQRKNICEMHPYAATMGIMRKPTMLAIRR